MHTLLYLGSLIAIVAIIASILFVSLAEPRVAVALGFFWVIYIAFDKFKEARDGRASWIEPGAFMLIGLILLLSALVRGWL